MGDADDEGFQLFKGVRDIAEAILCHVEQGNRTPEPARKEAEDFTRAVVWAILENSNLLSDIIEEAGIGADCCLCGLLIVGDDNALCGACRDEAGEVAVAEDSI